MYYLNAVHCLEIANVKLNLTIKEDTGLCYKGQNRDILIYELYACGLNLWPV